MEMQYALLIYESPEDFASRSADQADEPEVRGLLALMLHCEARRPERRNAIPLSNDRLSK
jgi:hypothetical protein